MKKQNDILALTKKVLGLAILSFLFNACADEDVFDKKGEVIEGIPVEVEFNFAASSMEKITTRGLSDAEEFQVNDLYILIFNFNGDQRKEGSGFYSSEDIIGATTGSQNGSTSKGTLKLNTTSGKSLIYGIANVKGNDLGGETLKNELDKVKTLSELNALTATLTTAGNVSRASATLVMSGTYKYGNNQEQPGYCAIPAQNATLGGKIMLSRLDSHITFRIAPLMVNETKWVNGKQVEGRIKSFTPTNWKVYNVPVKSYLIAQNEDAADKIGVASKNYNETAPSIRFDADPANKNIHNFDFYMLENRKASKNNIKTYEQREKEEKGSEGQNSGIYTYVEPNATFVEIKAHIEIEKEGTDNGIRIADVTYVVHLGYVGNNAADFNSLRNKKYTYNISIIDVDNIVAEVQSGDEGEELQPGAEGDVVDSQTEVYNIDSHYGYIILGFSYKDVENDLNFYIKTPYGETTEKDFSARDKRDYKWIRFKRNSSNAEKKLEKYPANGEGLIDLFNLKADIEKQYETDGNKDKIYYYTAFIDEYYYEQNPCGNTQWNRAKWEEFVNTENRYVLLLFSPQYSKDHESSYAGAKYMITQKSIQTYYSHSETALGMEHENETGKPKYNKSSMGTNDTYGYANIYNKWNNNKLEDYADVTIPSNNTFQMKSNKRDAIYDCMSRNRDEDGNGKIEGKEIKWYLPATQQLVGMFLGAESLTTPLFGNADKQPGRNGNKTAGTYHYITSNNQRIWAEEGASFGSEDTSEATASEQLRCVRNLGVDPDEQVSQPTTNKVANIYTYNNNTKVLSMTYMNAHSIRTSKVENAELATHHNFSTLNTPYKSFQVAKEVISTIGQDKYKDASWKDLVNYWNGHSRCYLYSELSDESDKGTWRAPNQRELMIMYMLDKNLVIRGANQLGSYSRTEWKFNKNYHFGVNSKLMFMDRGGNGGSYIRCVRDRN